MKRERSLDPEAWVDHYGDYLFRYAVLRLRDAQTTEDIVQETFLAALHARGNFMGRSSERTWLTGILKNKIADFFRKTARNAENPGENMDNPGGSDFDEKGRWISGPSRWTAGPEAALVQKEFRTVLHSCLSLLPSSFGPAFMLREIEELRPDEICKILNITAINLSVRIHRARHLLRRCLELKWFGKKG